MDTQKIYHEMGISSAVLEFCRSAEDELKPRFAAIDEIAEFNQAKVVAAMQKNRVSAECFAASTGYGYNDIGREALEKVYADTFHTEAALVRPQITCGTHALAVALSANLLPGDELLAISGKPYDTLEEVIGLRESPCSLKEYGVSYAQVDLREDGSFDFPAIERALNDKTKLIHIQRSKGYCPRPTISVDAIGEAIAFCKKLRPDVVVMVDNCYGEFVEANEPSDFGADMIVGSLIKNPGGGLAPIGGYIKNIAVKDGEYVTAGQTLGTVSQNQRLVLRAEVSEKYYKALNTISSANFKTPYDNQVYALSDLKGRLLSIGKTAGENSFFVPVSFEFDNRGDIVPGAFVEIFLESTPLENVITVPVSALTNEMGIFYVYVQLDEEGYRKQEVKTGASNGKEMQIISGLQPGDRVVTKGAYQVKMASASGAIPHGHEH